MTITPDWSDPEWANVQHDTMTIDCKGGYHPVCRLPEHCQCICHTKAGDDR